MSGVRKSHSASFKAKVALEALKQDKTIAQLSSEYGVHSNQISRWKQHLANELPGIFTGRKKAQEKKKAEELQAELYRQIGSTYQKPNLSKASPGHKKYPYLLKNMVIDHPDQVWSTDITYIRMRHGFVYLTAVIDWFSRYVLSYELSTTLDTGFCIEAVNRALNISKPEIFNTDQGSQFTSEAFIECLESRKITISMDGRGRALDNIFVERLWRSVKYEEVYLKDYETVKNAISGLFNYFDFYNNERGHQSLQYQTPYEVYAKNK